MNASRRLQTALLSLALALAGAARAAEPATPHGDVERARRIAVEFWSAQSGLRHLEFVEAIQRGDWDTLERIVAAAQDEYEQDPRRGEPLVERYVSWSRPPRLAPFLERWVAERPSSWVARIARASLRVEQGWEARGGKWASQTPAHRFEAMRERFAEAEADLAVALAARPRLLPAHRLRITMAKSVGDSERVRGALADALRVDPAAYYVRWSAIEGLQPRWGGSYSEMEAVAREAQRYVDENPLLYQLLGTPHAERAEQAFFAKDFVAARRAWGAALSYGRILAWLYARANLAIHELRDYPAALVDIEELLSYDPEDARALTLRSQARYYQGDHEGWLADAARAASLAPYDAWVVDEHARALRRHGRLAEAAEASARAFELDPRRRIAAGYRAAWIYFEKLVRPAAASRLLARLVEIDPGSTRYWSLYGASLAESGDAHGARRAFERYLALVDENDPKERDRVRRVRAWLETKAPPANASP